jgi:predicted HicB family RNase H-like nuclease
VSRWTPIRVDLATHARLRTAAAERDVSIAWLANRLLAEGLDALKPEFRLIDREAHDR